MHHCCCFHPVVEFELNLLDHHIQVYKLCERLKTVVAWNIANFHNYYFVNRLQYILKWIKQNSLGQAWRDIEQT